METTALLTGGLGFIGSHLSVELIQNNYNVIIIDNLSNSNIDVLDNLEKITDVRPLFYKCDVNDKADLDKIFYNNKIDVVIHLAGHKSVGESVKDPLKYYENNVGGLLSLLRCMNEHKVKKLIFSSSATVYGNPESLPLTEESNINILNPYGQTKRTSELILKDCASAYDLSVISLRYFNPVGAHPSGLLSENPVGGANNLFPVIMSVYNGQREQLEVFGTDYENPDGSGIRDYIHVCDVAKGHLQALKYLKSGYEVFNLGTGNGYSVLEIINKFEFHSNKTLPYILKDRRIGDSAAIYADCTKANKELQWNTTYNLDDMIKHTLNSRRGFKVNNIDNKMFTTTFVTAFYKVKDFNVPNKSTEIYFDYFKKLVATGIPLSVYISPEYADQLEEIAKENSNVKISKVIDIKDTLVYKMSNVPNIKLPNNRNPIKDTFEYMVCQNSKIECIADTIEKNPFNTEQFAWTDFGLMHVIKNIEEASNTLKKIATTQLIENSLIFPGCWNKGYNYLDTVNWRVAGGFVIGHKDQLIDMWNRYQDFLPKFIQKYNLMIWEVNVWCAMEMETDFTFQWFIANHDDSIINIPEQYFIK